MMIKKIILIVLAIIGVIAPCVVTVNICRACEEERMSFVEYIDVDEEAITAQETCGARLRVHIVAEKIKTSFRKLVETATVCSYRDDVRTPKEKRKTHLFYARQAGGLPSDTLSPI